MEMNKNNSGELPEFSKDSDYFENNNLDFLDDDDVTKADVQVNFTTDEVNELGTNDKQDEFTMGDAQQEDYDGVLEQLNEFVEGSIINEDIKITPTLETPNNLLNEFQKMQKQARGIGMDLNTEHNLFNLTLETFKHSWVTYLGLNDPLNVDRFCNKKNNSPIYNGSLHVSFAN
ncbi:hypothetical protein AKO1_002504 [Acrasis kona]|uniref:Uncharacterized protein n=1 Tax=Acrasis kona TaxID=1008807 RepID=A0AAW2ZLS2_9EUKA